MKITIEPTKIEPGVIHSPIVIMDTGNDDDGTGECVELALRALIAAGHHHTNVWQEAIEIAEEHLPQEETA